MPLLKSLLKFVWYDPSATATAYPPTSTPKALEGSSAQSAELTAHERRYPNHVVMLEDGSVVSGGGDAYIAGGDVGFEATPWERILNAPQISSRISRIMRMASFDGALSREMISEVIGVYVRLVHHLPATESDHHTLENGLVTLGLDAAYHSLLKCHDAVFTNESPDKRYVDEPRWKMAVFISALFCESYSLYSSISIVDANQRKWEPLTQGTLAEWFHENGIERYWVRWDRSTRKYQDRHYSVLAVNRFLPAHIIEYVSGNASIKRAMTDFLADQFKGGQINPIVNIVSIVRERIIRKDTKNAIEKVTQLRVGHSLERYVLDVLRSQFREKISGWVPNEKGSRVWATTEGLFVIWKTGGAEIIARMRRNQVPMLPEDLATIPDILDAMSLVTRTPEGALYWKIYPKDAKTPSDALRFTNPEMMFDEWDEVIENVDFKLIPEDLPDKSKNNSKETDKRQEKENVPVPSVAPSSIQNIVDQTTSSAQQKAAAAAPSPEPESSDLPDEENQEPGHRELSRLTPSVANLIRMLVEKHSRGVLELYDFDVAVGIPKSEIAAEKTGVPILTLITALHKEGMLYVPPGQAKKIITIATESGSTDYIAITKIYAKKIFSLG